jgi:hypothetical protein
MVANNFDEVKLMTEEHCIFSAALDFFFSMNVRRECKNGSFENHIKKAVLVSYMYTLSKQGKVTGREVCVLTGQMQVKVFHLMPMALVN